MRILIDFTHIPLQKMGAGNYALNLINHLYQIDRHNSYYILLQDDETCFDTITSKRFQKIYIPAKIFRRFFCRFLLEQIYIPWIIKNKKIEILHSLHYTFPFAPSKAKKIVTIHDMTFILFPEYHQWIKKVYFSFFIKKYDRFVQKLISVSHATLVDYLKIKRADKVITAVVPLGKTDWGQASFSNDAINKIKNKYGIVGEYLLFIGTIEPRKNLTTLLAAYEKVLSYGKKIKLVIAGKKGWRYQSILKFSEKEIFKNNLIFTGYFEEKDKPFLLKGAKLFIYPSLYEGFGIPVLEAMSLGAPTITSNVSSLPEVARSGAMMVDPKNSTALFRCVIELLENKEACDNLRRNAIKRASNFSWRIMACETLLEYYRVMHNQ